MLTFSRRESGVVTIGVDAELYVELHKNLQEIVADSKFNLVFTIQPIGKAGIEKGNFYGGNCMKISPESQSCMLPTIPISTFLGNDLMTLRNRARDHGRME